MNESVSWNQRIKLNLLLVPSVFSTKKVKHHFIFSLVCCVTIIMGDDDRQLKYINVGMEFTNKVTKKILENLDEDEQAEQLEIMREVMKEYIKMEHEYNISKTVIGKLKKGLEVEAADMDRDIDEDYKSHLATELEKNPVTDYGVTHDQRYRQLESIISGLRKETVGPSRSAIIVMSVLCKLVFYTGDFPPCL